MGHFVCAELLVASMCFSHVKHFGSIPDLSAATKMEGIMVAMQAGFDSKSISHSSQAGLTL